LIIKGIQKKKSVNKNICRKACSRFYKIALT
jgi:hypothetical protein